MDAVGTQPLPVEVHGASLSPHVGFTFNPKPFPAWRIERKEGERRRHRVYLADTLNTHIRC